MSGESNESNELNDKLKIASMLTENVLQRYMAYVDNSTVEELFPTVATENTFIEFKKNDCIFKLQLDIVNSDYMFPLENCDSEIVRNAMTNMIQSCVIVYGLLLKNIKNKKSDIFNHPTILSTDPVNTTIVINSQLYGEMISKFKSRIGFVWA